MADQDWRVRKMIEALTKSPPDAKAYCEMGPNGAGAIASTHYGKVRGADAEMTMLLDR